MDDSRLAKRAPAPELIAALVALAVVVLLLLLFVTHYFKAFFTSDEATLSLLAEQMWRQGRLLPHGWITNNGDLMMPSAALVIAPLLRWLPIGFAVHSIFSVVAIVAMLASFTTFLRLATMPTAILLLAVGVLASGPSWVSAVLIYAQTSHMWLPSAFALGATLIWSYRTRQRNAGTLDRIKLVLLFALLFTISFSNPMRAAVMLIFPLYAFDRAVCAGLSTDAGRDDPRAAWLSSLGLRDPFTMIGVGGGFVVAALIYYTLLRSGVTETRYFASNLRWDGFGSVARHGSIFAHGWFQYLGAANPPDVTGSFAESILQKIRLLFAIWLTWVAFAEVVKLIGIGKPAGLLRRATAVAFVAAFVPIFVIYILFEPLAIDDSTMRYFTVPIVILTALAAFRLGARSPASSLFARSAIVAASIVLVVVAAQRFVPPASWSSPTNFWTIQPSPAMRFVDVLREHELHWGYATWWNAEAATVLSEGRVRVQPVSITEKLIEPFPVMVQRDWYAPAQWQGESFLAFDRSEATTEQIADIAAVLGPPARTINSPDHVIFVYNHNIAADFSCGVRNAMSSPLDASRPTGRIIAAAQSHTTNGTPAQTAEIVVRNDSDQPFDGIGDYPISIGMQLLDESGAIANADWLHSPLPCPIAPGEQQSITVILPPIPAGNWEAKVDLVQERVAWFGRWGTPTVSMALQPATNR